MRITITRVLIPTGDRYTFTVDTDTMSRAMAGNIVRVVERVKFFQLPRLIRDDAPGECSERVRLEVQDSEQQHAIHGDFDAIPEPLHYLVWELFEQHLRQSSGQTLHAAEHFQSECTHQNNLRLAKAVSETYRQISPTMHANPALADELRQMLISEFEQERFSLEADGEIKSIIQDLLGEAAARDSQWWAVLNELVFIFGSDSMVAMSNDMIEARARVIEFFRECHGVDISSQSR